MKKAFLIILLLLPLSCVCLVNESDEISGKLPLSAISVRSGSEANLTNDYFVSQDMAELFVSSQKDNPPIVSIDPYVFHGNTCFYIINFEKGYTIISADTRIQPVLAKCEEGNLFAKETDNPGIKVWLEDTADRISILKNNEIEVKEDYSDIWRPFSFRAGLSFQTRSFDVDSVWIKVVETTDEKYDSTCCQVALMNTQWGQGNPWKNTMPYDHNHFWIRCVTGCAAVAISQVLKYFNENGYYPRDLWHNVSVSSTSVCPYPYSNYVTTTLSKSGYTANSTRWGAMPNTKTGTNTAYVSQLMLDIGNRVNMHYSENDSFVIPSQNGIPNLSLCGISSSYGQYIYATAVSNIGSKKPVIISAYALQRWVMVTSG